MKKLIALLALLALCCTACIGFAEEIADADLLAARSYLRMMYKNSPETTMVDYDVVGVLNIGGVEYPIEWTTDSDTIKIIVNDNNQWECPACHNTDRAKMNVTRRTCGYLGENYWNVGKTKEIKSRVLHL